MAFGIPFKLLGDSKMFLPIPKPRRAEKQLVIDKFAPRRVSTDCLVLGHVGPVRECINFAMQTKVDYGEVRRETLGFSASPKFWTDFHKGVTDVVFDPAQCALFGHDIDIVDEDVDVCWIKVHIASDPMPYPSRSDLMTHLFAAFEALTKASDTIDEVQHADVLDGIDRHVIKDATRQLGQMLHLERWTKEVRDEG